MSAWEEYQNLKYPDWVIVTKPGEIPVLPDREPVVVQKVFVGTARKDQCVYCDEPLTERTRTRDHFVPRSKGGRGSDNIVPSCSMCNNAKGDYVFSSIEAAREHIAKERKRTATKKYKRSH